MGVMARKHSFNAKVKSALEKLGYTFAPTEHFNFYTGRTNDLFGIFDGIAIHPEKPGVLGLQWTDYTSASAHRRKIFENPIHETWLKAGNRIELWLYKPYLKGTRTFYTLAKENITLDGAVPCVE